MEAVWRRAGAYVICRNDAGQILLVRGLDPGGPEDGHWTLPGGGTEWGESPEQTALRELGEETGLTARLGSIAGVFSRWYDQHEAMRGEPGHLIGTVFHADQPRGELRSEPPGSSTDRAEWFTLEDARTLPAVELLTFGLALI